MICTYLETNFILELAFAQEQNESCKAILALAESGTIKLVLPAFSFGECFETLGRRIKEKNVLQKQINTQTKQLERSQNYKRELQQLEDFTSLLVRINEEDQNRLDSILSRMIGVSEIIPLDKDVVQVANLYRKQFKLEAQDSIVFASIISHLKSSKPSKRCFLNRNSRDFDDPDIRQALSDHDCKLLFDFDSGIQFISGHAPHHP
ncbi:MAG: PIN domain-containing protein [Planctomycetota bacterium]|nr:PIN domain-containing protein [Planctomycetota bacterium]